MGVTKKVQEGKRLERVQATREPGKAGQVILREKYRCHGRKCVQRYTGTAGQGGHSRARRARDRKVGETKL